MVITALTYTILAVSALLGSAIAWDDLKRALKSKARHG
jgi:hypothetical protein